HKDIEDEGQTIEVVTPTIGTQFFELDTENKFVTADGVKNLVDVIKYDKFSKGNDYKAYLTVMDYETGDPVVVNGEKVTAELEFTVDEETGEVRVPLSLDTKGLENKRLVAFEEIVIVTEDGEEPYAEHKDIEDEGQTIEVEKTVIETFVKNVQTGDKMFLIIVLGVIAIGGVIAFFLGKKFKK
ncbi:MAG: VaFE repeat-containing surface-anchored protein, partial [Suipraeoptans sp.]